MNINIDIYLRGAFQELSAFSIPDIGTFRKINRGSWIDESGLHLHPPGTDIEFSTEIDPTILLSTYFTEKIKLEEEVAEQISTQIRQVILHELRQKGKFEIAEIGLLKKGDNHILTFENYDNQTNNLSEDYFGLSPINIKEPTTEIATIRKNTDMKKPDRPESKKILSLTGLKSILLVALLTALCVFILRESPITVHRSSLSQGVKVRFNAPESVEDRLAARRPAEKRTDSDTEELLIAEADQNSAPEVETSGSDQVEPQSPKSREIPEKKLSPQEEEVVPAIEDLLAEGPATENPSLGRSRGQDDIPADANARLSRSAESDTEATQYHLIVGSFKSLNSANKAVSKWKSQGYDAIVLFPAAGSSLTHRVSVYKSFTRADVESFANKLKAKGKKSTWIFEDKKQN